MGCIMNHGTNMPDHPGYIYNSNPDSASCHNPPRLMLLSFLPQNLFVAETMAKMDLGSLEVT